MLYCTLARHVLAPVLDYARGTSVLRCWNELEKSQWWPREKLLELQNQRLVRLVTYACEHVPYYRRLFEKSSLKASDIRSVADLVKLPLLTRQRARLFSRDLMAPDFPPKEKLCMYTGGSTGEPLAFFTSRDEKLNWGVAAAERSHKWAGYKLGCKTATILVVRPYKSCMEKWSTTVENFFSRVLVIDARKISPKTLAVYADRLHAYQPEIIRAYPSALELLARHIQRQPAIKIRPKAIIVGAEQLCDHQRDLFTGVFKCETYRYYSSWEVYALAAECPAHKGLHIASENVIIEVVDDDGRPMANGKEGRLIITNLHNYAMPFIRYEIGDLGALSAALCACGRGLPLLSNLAGRSSDIIITRDGKTIPGAALLYVFREPMGIAHFQLVQEGYDLLTVNVVPDSDYSEADRAATASKIVRGYRDVLGEKIQIVVKFVDSIPTTKDGKRRLILSRVRQIPDDPLAPSAG